MLKSSLIGFTGKRDERPKPPVSLELVWRTLMDLNADSTDVNFVIPGNLPLSRGNHVGFRWLATHNGRGYRCGFILIPPGHPWHGKAHGQIGARVHGGLSWSGHSSTAYCLGFECNCDFDAPDLSLPMEPEVADRLRQRPIPDGTQIRTQEYVEKQCRDLCEQAAAAANGDE